MEWVFFRLWVYTEDGRRTFSFFWRDFVVYLKKKNADSKVEMWCTILRLVQLQFVEPLISSLWHDTRRNGTRHGAARRYRYMVRVFYCLPIVERPKNEITASLPDGIFFEGKKEKPAKYDRRLGLLSAGHSCHQVLY